MKVQLPLASATAVSAICEPSTVKLTVAKASVVPDSAAFEVTPSVAERPVSSVSAAATVGDSVLTRNGDTPWLSLPAMSVALAP